MYNPDEECKAMIETIKRLCEQKNMTLHALAKEVGKQYNYFTYAERERSIG